MNVHDNRHFTAGCWELYLNWLFIGHGLRVEKVKEVEGQNTPDFIVTGSGFSFYVEATSSGVENMTIWDHFVQNMQALKRADYYVGLSLKKQTPDTPSAKKAVRGISNFLNSLPKTSDAQAHSLAGSKKVHLRGWEFEVSAYNLPPGSSPTTTIKASIDPQVRDVSDARDLRIKIEKKRHRYPDLEFPLVIAVLQNSTFESDAKEQRYAAFFGDLQVCIHEDGSHTLGRAGNGLWSGHKAKDNSAGYLLCSGLPLGSENIEAPELWVNPYRKEQGLYVLSFGVVYSELDGEYRRILPQSV
jgi:hypothetical protein